MEAKLYSVAEAAERLGCTQKTVRNRIKRGDIPAERVEIPGGFAYRVALPEAPLTAPGEGEEMASPTVQAILGLLKERDAEVKRLQGELLQAVAQASMFQERSSSLQKLLEAPKTSRPSWWRRVLGKE